MNNQVPVLQRVEDSLQLENMIDTLEGYAVDVRKEATSLVCTHRIPNGIITSADQVLTAVQNLRALLYARKVLRRHK